MMAAPKSVFEVRRAANFPLSPVERTILDLCKAAAKAGLPAPSSDQLAQAIGANGVATVPGILKRLEAKGYITRQVFQRGRTICIASTGQCTAPPSDQTPHWRFITDRIPTPAIQAMRERSKTGLERIEALARRENTSIMEMAMKCVWAGLVAIESEEIE